MDKIPSLTDIKLQYKRKPGELYLAEFKIFVNNTEIHSDPVFLCPTAKNVTIYASDPWFKAARAAVKNFRAQTIKDGSKNFIEKNITKDGLIEKSNNLASGLSEITKADLFILLQNAENFEICEMFKSEKTTMACIPKDIKDSSILLIRYNDSQIPADFDHEMEVISTKGHGEFIQYIGSQWVAENSKFYLKYAFKNRMPIEEIAVISRFYGEPQRAHLLDFTCLTPVVCFWMLNSMFLFILAFVATFRAAII